MRYQKGSIGLNDRRDKAILHFVADSRHVTHSQLWELSKADYAEVDRRVFNWRIRRLVQSGLVRKQVPPFLNGEALYSISGRGIQALERLASTIWARIWIVRQTPARSRFRTPWS